MRKLLAIVTGLAVISVTLEIVLRVVGSLHTREAASELRSLPKTRDTRYTILCLGDSFTYGIGAPRAHSYPRQLERLLNDRAGERLFRIINNGKGGQNSAQLLASLEETLQRVRPDLVTILIGSANENNYWGYLQYVEREQRDERVRLGNIPDAKTSDTPRRMETERRVTILSNLQDRLYRIRTFKLARLLWAHVMASLEKRKEKFTVAHAPANEGWRLLQKGHYQQAAEWFKNAIGDGRGEADLCNGLGEAYRALGKFDKARDWFEKGIAVNPRDSHNYSSIGLVDSAQGDYQRAIPWFQKALRIDPSALNRNGTSNQWQIGWLYGLLGETEKAIEWFKEGVNTHPHEIDNYSELVIAYESLGRYHEAVEFFRHAALKNPELRGFNRFLKKKRDKFQCIERWIISDMECSIQICDNNGIPVILQNFPEIPYTSLKKLAARYSIPFVDHQAVFSKLLHTGKKRETLFASDNNHCNAKGYEIMARKLFSIIARERFFDEIL